MTNPDSNQNFGKILLICTLPWPWPVREKTKIVESRSGTISAETDGCLSIRIVADNRTFEFQSCSLILEKQTSTNIGVSWSLPDVINMVVGQTIVLSTERPDSVPREAHIQSGVPNDVRDFTEVSTQARLRRRDTLAGSKSAKKLKPFREATPIEIFDALQKAQRQIADLLKLVEQGRVDHVDGLLRLLRLTITDADDKPMPLLQLCAAMIDAPLIVYAPPINDCMRPLQMDGVETFAAPITLAASDLCKNPVDLDFWLSSRAAQIKGKVLTQKKLLENIANSIAAHFDLYVRPETEMLSSWKSEINGVTADFVVQYTLTIASVINDVINVILAKRPN